MIAFLDGACCHIAAKNYLADRIPEVLDYPDVDYFMYLNQITWNISIPSPHAVSTNLNQVYSPELPEMLKV